MKYTFKLIVFSLFLTSCTENYPEFGNGYRIVGEGGYTSALVDSSNTELIPEYILEYAVDSNFILIAQSPTDSLPKMDFIYYSDKDRKEMAANRSVYRQYWIINKSELSIYASDSIQKLSKRSNVYGPFTKSEYSKTRVKLHIPESTKLENE
ncbi:DUF3997 domain-containing protein [Algoriphagus formosus]|nr:DUF3997 domain-containing protein [Algoriphagus aquimaris]